jgi:hypothetical protein
MSRDKSLTAFPAKSCTNEPKGPRAFELTIEAVKDWDMALLPVEISPGVTAELNSEVIDCGLNPEELAHWFDSLGLNATLTAEDATLFIRPPATLFTREFELTEIVGMTPEKAIISTPGYGFSSC